MTEQSNFENCNFTALQWHKTTDKGSGKRYTGHHMMAGTDLVPVESELGLIGTSSSSRSLQLSDDQIESLRQNREAHRYKQIWTKDPHAPRGGYKKVRPESRRSSVDFFDRLPLQLPLRTRHALLTMTVLATLILPGK